MASLSTKKFIDVRNKGYDQNANNISSLLAEYARKCARETECSVEFCHSGQDKGLRILGKFIKSQKATSPSVRSHRTTWLPLDGFS
jgi:hypothetical protein